MTIVRMKKVQKIINPVEGHVESAFLFEIIAVINNTMNKKLKATPILLIPSELSPPENLYEERIRMQAARKSRIRFQLSFIL
jgi:hypothetical protein